MLGILYHLELVRPDRARGSQLQNIFYDCDPMRRWGRICNMPATAFSRRNLFTLAIFAVSPACDSGESAKCSRSEILYKVKAAKKMAVNSNETVTPDCLSDALVRIGASRDRDAFREIYEHFYPRVTSFILDRSRNRATAEEVAQQTMINVWRKAGQFQPEKAAAATWVFTIARNVHIDLFRKAKRPDFDPNDPAFVPDAEPLAHDALNLKQEAARLKKIIAALPEEQQDVLRLAFFQEKPHPEIAAELNIPLGTVKSRIRLAFKRIRSELGDQE